MPVGLPPTLEIRPVPMDTSRSQVHAQDLTRDLHESLLRSQRQGLSRSQLDVLRERRHIDIMPRPLESPRSHLDITRVQDNSSRVYDRSRSHFTGIVIVRYFLYFILLDFIFILIIFNLSYFIRLFRFYLFTFLREILKLA